MPGANNPNRMYTDFEPHCIWHRNEDSDTLDVHLDGFIKEQLKVQINNERILTISGERPQKDKNEWNRFRKEIKLADNTKDNDIRAKLARGILSIVMPKKPDILSLSIPLPSNVLQTAQPKPKKETTAATQKGNDTVSESENVDILWHNESGGWMLKMDKNMGVKVGVALVFLLVGFWVYVKCSCRKPFDLCDLCY